MLDTLSAIAPALDATGLGWGPAGGAGFELATGARVLRDTSDLDLIVRAEPTRDIDALAAFHRAAASGQVRVDVLVETARGAVAIAELFAGKDAVVMRTPSGPRLVPTSELGSPASGK